MPFRPLLKALRLSPYAKVVVESPLPAADALYDKVSRGDYLGAELMFAKLSDESQGFVIWDFADMEDAVDLSRRWASGARQSALALTLVGAALISAGWRIRGTGYAADVADDAIAPFIEHLHGAKSALEEALALDAKSVHALNMLITVGYGSGQDRAWIAHCFAEGLRRNPTHMGLHLNYLTVTTRKWGGSHKAMFAFAADCSAKAAPGSPLHTLVPMAYAEYALAQNSAIGRLGLWRLKDRANARNLVSALYKWLDAKPGELASKLRRVSGPYARFGLNHFGAMLYLCGANEEAKLVLAALRGEIDARPWNWLSPDDWLAMLTESDDNPAFVYDKACRALGVKRDW